MFLENTKLIIPGCYLATIIDVNVATLPNGEEKINSKGNDGIDITFELDNGDIFRDTFWFGEAAKFRIDLLIKAVGLNNIEDALGAGELIDKQLFIIVGVQHNSIKDVNFLLNKFIKVVHPELKPRISQSLLHR